MPLPVPLDDLAVKPLDRDKLLAFLTPQDFRTLLARIARLGERADAGRRRARPPPTARSLPAARAGARHARRSSSATSWSRMWRRSTAGSRRRAHRRFVAIDTETTSLDAMRWPSSSASRSRSRRAMPATFPLGHGAPTDTASLDLAGAGAARRGRFRCADALARLKPLLEDESVLKIGHNIKYDIEVLAGCGITVAPTDCTMLMSFVLDGALHGHGLDELAKLHFGHDTINYKDVAGSGKDHIGFAAVPLERARDYAAEDADFTLRLHRRLKPRLIAEHMLAFYETVERPLAAVVAAMERAGIAVDRVELERLSADFAGRIAALEREIHKLAGHPFNIGSPKQLGEVLFDELSLPGGKKGKTGAYGTDAGVLEQLALTHDLPARVLDWRQLAKLKSTYADALVGEINPRTGRVHTSFSLAATSTGRLVLDRSQSAEHPDPHRGRAQDPPRLRRRAGPCADLGRLQPDRAAPGRACRRRRAAQGSVPRRRRHPRADRERGVRRAGRGHGRRWCGAAPRRSISASSTASAPSAWRSSSACRRARRPITSSAYFQRFPGIRDYMERTKAEARATGLCRDAVRAALLHIRHQGRQSRPPRRRRAPGDQRAAPGRRRRHHQARHAPHSGGPRRGRPEGAHAASGA